MTNGTLFLNMAGGFKMPIVGKILPAKIEEVKICLLSDLSVQKKRQLKQGETKLVNATIVHPSTILPKRETSRDVMESVKRARALVFIFSKRRNTFDHNG